MSLHRQRLSAAPAHATPAEASAAVPRRDFLARTVAALGAGMLVLAGRPALPGGEQARAATTGIDPFLGEIMLFAGNFAPVGYAACNGQLMPIAQNTALFSLIGTMYGGDGRVTFGLPDLRGRAPIHIGQGPGLPNYLQGSPGGTPEHTLLATEMPSHSHTVNAVSGNGIASGPGGALPARDPSGTPSYATTANTTMAANAIAVAGGSQPHNNMPPYLPMIYCIALQGVFPSRP